MTYDWSALVFVERWRTHFARGVVFGMRRPADRTTFEVRIQTGQWGTTAPGAAVEARLLDVGDLLREKRIPLTATLSLVVQVMTPVVHRAQRPERGVLGPASRRALDEGSRLVGEVVEVESERRALLGIGFPVVVDVTGETGLRDVKAGDWVELAVAGMPRGYLIVG